LGPRAQLIDGVCFAYDEYESTSAWSAPLTSSSPACFSRATSVSRSTALPSCFGVLCVVFIGSSSNIGAETAATRSGSVTSALNRRLALRPGPSKLAVPRVGGPTPSGSRRLLARGSSKPKFQQLSSAESRRSEPSSLCQWLAVSGREDDHHRARPRSRVVSVDGRDAQLVLRAADGRVVKAYRDAPAWSEPIVERLTPRGA